MNAQDVEIAFKGPPRSDVPGRIRTGRTDSERIS